MMIRYTVFAIHRYKKEFVVWFEILISIAVKLDILLVGKSKVYITMTGIVTVIVTMGVGINC